MKDIKISTYGQVFTRPSMVGHMMSLIGNANGMRLEPSAGTGNFWFPMVQRFGPASTIGVELDPGICPSGCINCDFFSFDPPCRFSTIIGNPPYVKYSDILESTRNLLSGIPLNGLGNLYMFFMWRCIDLLDDGGELIFVVPRDFIKTTSAIPLNRRMFTEGGFTHFEEFGDQVQFDNASPNVAIFRWVKGRPHAIDISERGGFLSFSRDAGVTVGDVFNVYVGGVSGDNARYYSDSGNVELVVSTTARDGKTRRAIYDNPDEWVRKLRSVPGRKIFVNSKTRRQSPFFIHDCCHFDGSVLCLEPKTDAYDIEQLCSLLNANDWDRQGFKVGGRLVFGQRSIQAATIHGLV